MNVSESNTVAWVGQSAEFSCWAAAAAMMLGWRDSVCYASDADIRAKLLDAGKGLVDQSALSRLADMAERAGGEVTKIERPWGEVFTLAEVQEALVRVKPRVVAIVHAETSTGAWQPIEEIAAAVRDAGAMLILDTVTALGGIPVEYKGGTIPPPDERRSYN